MKIVNVDGSQVELTEEMIKDAAPAAVLSLDDLIPPWSPRWCTIHGRYDSIPAAPCQLCELGLEKPMMTKVYECILLHEPPEGEPKLLEVKEKNLFRIVVPAGVDPKKRILRLAMQDLNNHFPEIDEQEVEVVYRPFA